MVAREENEPQDTSYPSLEGGRVHAFPNIMLATLCANNHQTSQQLSIKDPACAQPAKQVAPNVYLRRDHPEEAGDFRVRAFPNSMLGTLGPNNSRKQPHKNRTYI